MPTRRRAGSSRPRHSGQCSRRASGAFTMAAAWSAGCWLQHRLDSGNGGVMLWRGFLRPPILVVGVSPALMPVVAPERPWRRPIGRVASCNRGLSSVALSRCRAVCQPAGASRPIRLFHTHTRAKQADRESPPGHRHAAGAPWRASRPTPWRRGQVEMVHTPVNSSRANAGNLVDESERKSDGPRPFLLFRAYACGRDGLGPPFQIRI